MNVTKKLDSLFSQYIRSIGECFRCQSQKNLQCAHIWTRGYKQIRWNPENALCLCQGCHLYFTHHPIEWQDFIEEHFPGRLYKLKKIAQEYGTKIDHEAIEKNLKNRIALLIETDFN